MNKMAARLSWLKRIRRQRNPLQANLPMATTGASGTSTSEESETTMDCRLLLTTLSGKEVEVSTNIAQYDRFEDFEEHIVDHLTSVTDLDVFGCEVDFVHPTTQAYLEDHIWEALQENRHFTIVFRDCLEALQTKEDFEDCAYRDIPKAVKSRFQPMNRGLSHPVLSLRSRECAVSSLKRAYKLLGHELGRTVVTSESSRCRPQLCVLKRVPFVGAIGSTA